MNSTLLGLILSGVAVTGLAISAYIVFVITFTKQVNTVNGILLSQLAITEFILCLLFLVCSMPTLVHTSELVKTSSSKSCTGCGFLFTFLRPIAIWTVCALNCDRYYAISAPLHYGSLVNPRKVVIAIALLWSSSLIFCLLPLLLATPYTYNSAFFVCIPKFQFSAISTCYATVHIALVFCMPLILIVACNLKVFLIARYHKHRIASAIFEVTLSAQVTITHQRNPFRPLWINRFKGRNAFFTVLQLVGSFLILYVPYYCIIFWDSVNPSAVFDKFENNKVPPYVLTLSYALVTCSSPVNGLLYGIKNKILRKSFQNYWRKKITKNKVNQEIQARTPSTCGSRRPSVTPIGLFTRQSFRRPSEFSIETQKSNILSSSFTKLHQCLGDITYRPSSSPGLDISTARNDSYTNLKKTHSFRSNVYRSSITSLRLANEGRGFNEFKTFQLKYNEHHFQLQKQSSTEESTMHIANSPNHFVQKFRKVEMTGYNKLRRKMRHSRKSPRILITRAFSEENDSKANISPPPKPCASVTTLLIDNTWKTGSRDRIIFDDYEDEDEEEIGRIGDYSNESSSDEYNKNHELTTPTKDESDNPCKNNIYKNKNNYRMRNNSVHSWPCGSIKQKNIKFCFGSLLLSEGKFSSNYEERTSDEFDESESVQCIE